MAKKLTHNEFIDKFKKINNKLYNQVKLLEEYKNYGTKILAETKYGLINISVDSLFSTNSINIRSAIDKTDYFKNMLIEKFGNKYDYSAVDYKGSDLKVTLICKEHGEFSVLPWTLLSLKIGCPKCATKYTHKKQLKNHELFLKQLKIENPNEFNNLIFLEKYNGRHTNILAKNKYGKVMVNPGSLLANSKVTIVSAIDKTAYIVSQFKELHGEKYDYSLVRYVKAKKKVKIICKKYYHGIFLITPFRHLLGAGCQKCECRYDKKYSKNGIPTYESFYEDFEFVGIKCRRDLEDNNVLNVKCHLCGKWFIPSYNSVTGKKSFINGFAITENNLYCSEECKQNCSIFGQQTKFKWQVSTNEHEEFGFYDSSLLNIWSKQVKENANYMCEKCGSKDNLQAHHIEPKSIAPEKALDPDNGLCLCKECHIDIHRSINGCGFNELKKCKIK